MVNQRDGERHATALCWLGQAGAAHAGESYNVFLKGGCWTSRRVNSRNGSGGCHRRTVFWDGAAPVSLVCCCVVSPSAIANKTLPIQLRYIHGALRLRLRRLCRSEYLLATKVKGWTPGQRASWKLLENNDCNACCNSRKQIKQFMP